MTLADASNLESPFHELVLELTGEPGWVRANKFERANRTSSQTRPRWPWILAGVAFVAYLAFGFWVLYSANYAIGDAMARASSARAIVHSRDQHLMAVGFYWAPLPAYAEVPFMAIFSRVGIADATIVVPTAVATALTIPVLAGIASTLRVPRHWAIPLIAVFALNPYTVFSAGSGMSEPWYVLFLAAATAAYLRWSQLGKARDLGALGIWLAFGQLSRHEFLPIVFIFAAAVGWQSGKKRRITTAAVVALPALFSLAIWTITSFLIVGHGFWQTITESGTGQTIDVKALHGNQTLVPSAKFVADLLIRLVPGLILLLFTRLGRELVGQFRSVGARERLVVLPLAAIAAYLPLLHLRFILAKTSYGDPRYFSPLIVVALIVALIAVSQPAWRRVRGVIAVGLALLGCITGLATLGNPKLSSVVGEPYVIRKLFRQNADVASGQTVVSRWRRLADDVDGRFTGNKKLVVDSFIAHPFIVLNDHPTRVATDRDKDFEQLVTGTTRANFDLALVSRNSPSSYNQQILQMIAGSSREGKVWAQVELPSASALGLELWELGESVQRPSRAQQNDGRLPSSSSTTTPRPSSSSTTVPQAATTSSGPSSEEFSDSELS